MKANKSDLQHQKDIGYNLMDKYLGALAGLADVKPEVNMKTQRIHENSTEAYHAMSALLCYSQQRVMSVILDAGSITRQGIAEVLQVPINEVTGRVRELLDEGLVIECGIDKTSGRSRSLLKANEVGVE